MTAMYLRQSRRCLTDAAISILFHQKGGHPWAEGVTVNEHEGMLTPAEVSEWGDGIQFDPIFENLAVFTFRQGGPALVAIPSLCQFGALGFTRVTNR